MPMLKNKNSLTTVLSIVATLLLAAALTGCTVTDDVTVFPVPDATNASENTIQSQEQTSPADQGDYIAHEWDAVAAPDGYLIQGDAIVGHNLAEGEYVYTGLDGLGRTQAAYACITTDDYAREKAEEREDFKSDADKISGWGYNAKASVTFPNGKTYNGYFYNRSHLIADSLGGTPARENLVTGTRFQNVGSGNGGMAYAEEKARGWLENAPAGSYIYYAATPVYVGDEPVPRSVYVDMLSSDGKVNEHVEVFNVSGDPLYGVDYSTGKIISK